MSKNNNKHSKFRNNSNSNNASREILLEEALNTFSKYIINCCNGDYKNFSSGQLAAFKNHYKNFYTVIENCYETTIKISNITHCLFTLIVKVGAENIKNFSLKILDDLINKCNIGQQGIPSISMVSKLTDIRNSVISPYTQNIDIESIEPTGRIINETITENETQNQNQNNFNSETIKSDIFFKKIKNILRRIMIKENNIKLIEFHKMNETTPSQLFYKKKIFQYHSCHMMQFLWTYITKKFEIHN